MTEIREPHPEKHDFLRENMDSGIIIPSKFEQFLKQDLGIKLIEEGIVNWEIFEHPQKQFWPREVTEAGNINSGNWEQNIKQHSGIDWILEGILIQISEEHS